VPRSPPFIATDFADRFGLAESVASVFIRPIRGQKQRPLAAPSPLADAIRSPRVAVFVRGNFRRVVASLSR
jgi:hypothetical protein